MRRVEDLKVDHKGYRNMGKEVDKVNQIKRSFQKTGSGGHVGVIE